MYSNHQFIDPAQERLLYVVLVMLHFLYPAIFVNLPLPPYR
jgi:hypothetical protein